MNQLGQDQNCSRDAEQDPGSVHQMIIFAVVFKQITWPNEGKIVWVNGRQRSLPIELLGPPDRKPRKLWMKHEKKTLNVSGEGSISEDGEQDFDECWNGHAGVRQSLPVLFSRLLQRAVDQECAVVTHERCTTTKVSHLFHRFGLIQGKLYRKMKWRSTGWSWDEPRSRHLQTEVWNEQIN